MWCTGLGQSKVHQHPAGEGGAGSGPSSLLFPAPLGLRPELKDQVQVESIVSQQLPSTALEFRGQGADRRYFNVFATQSMDCRWVFWNLRKANPPVRRGSPRQGQVLRSLLVSIISLHGSQ